MSGGNKKNIDKYMKYFLSTFYVFALGVLVFLVFYWIVDRETFYFLDNNIHIATNTSYAIDVVGKSTEKSPEDLIWTSSNPDIISIDDRGNIKALKQGIVTIRAKSKLGLVKRSIRVSASDFIIYSIVFGNDRMVINQNEEVTLSPILNGSKDIRSSLTWSSSNPSIATVDSSGVVKGNKEGSTYIIAKDEYSEHSAKVRIDVTGEVKVEVADHDQINDSRDNYESESHETDVNVESINMNLSSLSLKIGQSSMLTVSIQPNNATNKKIIWKSTDEQVATVDSSGKVVAVGEGDCIIYATSVDGDKSAFSTVHVQKSSIPIVSVSFSNSQYTMHVGEKFTLIPQIKPTNATSQKLTWKSSNEKIATVDSNGIVHAKSVGIVEMMATTENNKKAKTRIVVKEAPLKNIYMESIDFNFSLTQLELGNSYQLAPSYQPKNVTNSNILYKSSMENVISISKDGKMVAKNPGFSVITAISQDGNVSNSILLFVMPSRVIAESIVLEGGAKQIKIGEKSTISYSLIPVNANSKKIEWISSNEAVASVDKSGKVVGLKSGTTTITAYIPNTGIKASMRLAVVPSNEVIPLKQQKLTIYKRDIILLEYQKNYSRAMQNFAIENIGTSKETFYFAYPGLSNASSKKKISNATKSSLVRTIVRKIPSSKLFSKKAENNSYMFLNGTGHAQSFDVVDGEMWLNGDGYIAESDGIYWGYYRSLIRTNFKTNKPNAKPNSIQSIKFSDSNGANYGNPEVGIDEQNDMIAIRSGSRVFIYQFSELKKGKHVLLYQFTMSNSINGKYYNRQGHDIANGYYYQYRGSYGTALYIEVYNMLGELKYVRKVPVTLKEAEAEGLKIYNNKIYIGVTYNSSKNGRYNNIYYFR